MIKSIYRKTVLDNGIRVVTEKINWVRSVSIGVWVDVGSRDETPKESGVSHFIEHMAFKGTKKRSAKEIASYLESVGGTLNAFTSREQTCFYARVLDRNLDLAVEVLSDILLNSLFNLRDFRKEKQVIIEEIKEIEDSPAELIQDLFMKTVWNSHPLGLPIMGDVKNIKSLTRKKLLEFMHRNYIGSKMVIAASGNLKHADLVRMVEKKFKLDSKKIDSFSFSPPSKTGAFHRVFQRKSAQTHICLGMPCFSFSHPQRYPAVILSNILGGGMSSRLFQVVREELGLTYNIYSFIEFFKDTGIFGVYLGTDRKQAEKSINLVLRELSKIKRNHFPKEEFMHAKDQLKGNFLLSLENTSNWMNRLARNELFLQKCLGVEKILKMIEGVTENQVIQTANQLMNRDRISLVVLGPVGENLVKKIDWDLLK